MASQEVKSRQEAQQLLGKMLSSELYGPPSPTKHDPIFHKQEALQSKTQEWEKTYQMMLEVQVSLFKAYHMLEEMQD